MDGWVCPLCNGTFVATNGRARHMRNMWKTEGDPTRCDAVAMAACHEAPTPQQVPLITVPSAAPVLIPLTQLDPVPIAAPLLDKLTNLARRKPCSWFEERQMRQAYTMEEDVSMDSARDMIVLQDHWDAYLRAVASICSLEFWTLFLNLHTCTATAIDGALNAVKKMYVREAPAKRMFPISRRSLFESIAAIRDFWPRVLHTYTIDLSQFNLPSGTTELKFKFIDPIWAWILAARRQDPLELHWKPAAQRVGREQYGGGIQHGECFKQICAELPPGGSPMCVGLNWDGTAAHKLSSLPICIGVGNSNSCKSDTQFCIGYVPHVPDEHKPEWAKRKDSTEVKFHVRQQCAKAILAVLEQGARSGVSVRLLNASQKEVSRVLFPRLTSMNFDQPEAQLFFGLQNKSSCSKCRRRKGYSCFRVCQPHNDEDIKRLYKLSNDSRSPHQQIARDKLHRWGFNYKRQCRLSFWCEHLLVKLPDAHEVFPCVDYRDRMHGITIFLHRQVYELLDATIKVQAHRRILDNRLSLVGKRKFRRDGKVTRSQRSIFTETGMTATDRMTLLFQLSHVVGVEPDNIIQAAVYTPLATVISHVQLILIAVNDRRSYTKQEFQHIIDRGFVTIFGAMESIRAHVYRKRVREWSRSSSGDPPKKFTRETRYAAN